MPGTGQFPQISLVTQKKDKRTLNGLRPVGTPAEILPKNSLYTYETVLYAVKSGKPGPPDQSAFQTKNRYDFMLEKHHIRLIEKKPPY